ncbi:hypothetical protein BZA05DRAFT_100393 [Tricharina praecox]|uniref:uncharacterized protein n=1 Tax=Tricharina praecox TaxID=43433 RepID=UPI00221FCF61|nr:uncharacterized protein BZA05DRAFT_100393 [Tricharina praecox]KAI5857596.1 hypothetical protein BZA05DRAFT_100393 [Tricharina praecox]
MHALLVVVALLSSSSSTSYAQVLQMPIDRPAHFLSEYVTPAAARRRAEESRLDGLLASLLASASAWSQTQTHSRTHGHGHVCPIVSEQSVSRGNDLHRGPGEGMGMGVGMGMGTGHWAERRTDATDMLFP